MRRWLPFAFTLAAATAPAAAQDLVAELEETGRFDRFLAGLRAVDLADRLRGGAVTVFAPTDEAYARVAEGELAALFEDDDRALVRRVLLTHIVDGESYRDHALPRTLAAASGDTITVRWAEGTLKARVDGAPDWPDAPVIEGGDIRAGNGIAHPLRGLLLSEEALAAVAERGEDVRAPSFEDDAALLDEVLEGADRETIARAPVEEKPAEPERRRGAAAGEPADEDDEVEATVTVEEPPPVEPRTVAPAETMGIDGAEPAASGERRPSADEGREAAADGPAEPAPAEGRVAVEEADPPANVVGANLDGWPVVGAEGGEVGEVEHVVVAADTGTIAALLVRVNAPLGIGLGGKLVRLAWSEVTIDAEDETIVAGVPGEELTGRPAVEGYELDP
jgi:uncharacterized surface protein with fasciclin (FAS1) repeats/sporulation protein YlmC with PRC-barrel domain